jgi:hypothetical protein
VDRGSQCKERDYRTLVTADMILQIIIPLSLLLLFVVDTMFCLSVGTILILLSYDLFMTVMRGARHEWVFVRWYTRCLMVLPFFRKLKSYRTFNPIEFFFDCKGSGMTNRIKPEMLVRHKTKALFYGILLFSLGLLVIVATVRTRLLSLAPRIIHLVRSLWP